MLRGFFQSIREQLRSAFRFGPLELVLCLAVTVSFSVNVSVDSPNLWEQWSKFAFGVAFALPLVFSASYLRLDGRIGVSIRWALSVLAVLFGAIFGATLTGDEGVMTWRIVCVIGSSLAIMMIAPGLAGVDRGAQHRYATHHLGHSALMLLNCLLLFGGLAAALAAIDQLFGIDIHERVYGHLAGATFFALFPALIVGGMDRLSAASRTDSGDLSFAAIQAARFVLAPLLLIYLLILYVYLATVVGSSEWPRNLISPLALAAAGIGVSGQILLGGVIMQEKYRGVSLIFRGFSFAILIPLLMSMTAIVMRIKQYGFTPSRYAVILLVIAFLIIAVVGVVRTLRKEAPPLFAVGFTAALLALFATIGPMSVDRVVTRSQAARVVDDAEFLELYANGAFLPADAMDARIDVLAEQRIAEIEARRDDAAAATPIDARAESLRSAYRTAYYFAGAQRIHRALGVDEQQAALLRDVLGGWGYWESPDTNESRWVEADGGAEVLRGVPASDVHLLSVYRRTRGFPMDASETAGVSAFVTEDGKTLVVSSSGTTMATFELTPLLSAMYADGRANDAWRYDAAKRVLRQDAIEVRFRSLMLEVTFEKQDGVPMTDEERAARIPKDYALQNAEVAVILTGTTRGASQPDEADEHVDNANEEAPSVDD